MSYTIAYNQNQASEFKVTDMQAAKEWADLMGVARLSGDTVLVTREFYERHYPEIHQIQMAAAWRLKSKNS